MPSRPSWSRGLVIGGLVGMCAGVLDPLEGSVVIAAGSLAAAAGGYLGACRRRKLMYIAAALTTIGVSVLWGISAVGGFGGSTGRSTGWALTLLPYPVGWVLGIVGAIRTLRERQTSPGSGALPERPEDPGP